MSDLLPHNANGIDTGDFVVRFQPDKIVFARKGSPEHFTLHFGGHWGELDLHRTWTDDQGIVQHQRLYAIRHDDIPNLLADFIPLVNELLALLKPVNFDELERAGITLIKGLDPVTNDQIEAVTVVRKRRLVVDPERIKTVVECPEDPRGLTFFEDGGFSLFLGRHRVGMGIKGTDRYGGKHLYWFKLSALRLFMRRAEAQIEEIFRIHGAERRVTSSQAISNAGDRA